MHLKKDDFSKGNHQIVKFKEMVHMLLYNNAAFLTTDNSIKSLQMVMLNLTH